MNRIKSFPLVYLATPYSKYPEGREAAFRGAARVAAKLLTAGVKVYSPIVHGHPLSEYGGIDPFDYNIWLPFDATMLELSSALLVVQMTGYRESAGIEHEKEFFYKRIRPIYWLDPKTMEVE